MTRRKKLLALLLALSVIFSLLPTAAFAQQVEDPAAVQAEEEAASEPEVQDDNVAVEPEETLESAEAPDAQEVIADEIPEEAPASAVEEAAAEEPVAETVAEVTAEAAKAAEEVPSQEATVPENGQDDLSVRRTHSGTSTKDAETITVDQSVSGMFTMDGAGVNTDYYKLVLPSSGTLELKGSSDVGVVGLNLLNASGAEVYTDAAFQLSTGVSIDLTKNTYYVVISKVGSDAGSYSFTPSFTAVNETVPETGNGINNSIKTAKAINLGDTCTGFLSITDKADYYKLSLATSGRLELAFRADGIRSINYAIIASNGEVVWSKTSGQGSTTSKENRLSNQIVDLTSGTYYLLVSQDDGTGKYLFRAKFTDAAETFPDKVGGSNNTFENAIAVAANQEYAGQLASNDTVDYYFFTVSQAKDSVKFSANTMLPEVDYVLYNSNHEEVWRRHSQCATDAEFDQVNYTMYLSKGTYYLAALTSNDYTGNYAFTLSTKNLFVPVIRSVVLNNGSITVKWDNLGTPQYRLFVKTTGGWKGCADTTATSYVFKNVKHGVTYSFTVRGLSKDGKAYQTSYDKEGKSITYYAAPVISSVNSVNGGVNVKWAKQAGVNQYRVFYRVGTSGSWIKASDTKGNSFTVPKLKSGTLYSFTVRALNDKGTVYISSYDNKGKSVTYLQVPVLTSVQAQNNGITVAWKAQTGAEMYRVFYRVGTGGWVSAGDTTSTNFTVKKLATGKFYTFTVRCVTKDGKRFTSSYDAKGIALHYLATPQATCVFTSNGVKVQWKEISGAQAYRVFYKGDTVKSWKALSTVTTNSYIATGLKSGKDYSFTVRCISKDGKSYQSGYNVSGKTIHYITPPAISALQQTAAGTVKVTWNASSGAVNYMVFYKGDKITAWTPLGTTTGTTFTASKLTAGKTYTFTVRTVDKTGKTYTSGYLSGKNITISAK